MPAYGHRQLDFVIPIGTSLSQALQLNGLFGEAIVMPAAWTAAGLSFEGADASGGPWQPLEDGLGVEMTVPVLASQTFLLPLGMLRTLNWLRLRSGTSTAPVNQLAARTVQLLARSYE
jgi:hypothetical protein